MVTEADRRAGQSSRAFSAWAGKVLVTLVAFAFSGTEAAIAEELEGLPTAVVVHGRRGPNSNLNGMYIRDFTWQGVVDPCYKRSGSTGGKDIFLYFEGEWRMGPSPGEGSVWAFASSSATSPLLIDAAWEVWDGHQVVEDKHMQVTDTSVVPQVLYISFGEGVPLALKSMQGMLLQQPGLWDGRPYYKHRDFQDLYLLCSVAEGRWRLGPLPLRVSSSEERPGRSQSAASAILFSRSAATLPQEIVEAWMVPGAGPGGADQLPDNSVRLLPPGLGAAQLTSNVAQPRHPSHLVVEGLAAGKGAANGVYRLAPELVNYRPAYHKTDALRTASLWFAGSEWRFGPSIADGRVWAYASAAAESPLAAEMSWMALDGHPEDAFHVADSMQVIPESVNLGGARFVQEKRLCDARPVYRRVSTAEVGAEADGGYSTLFQPEVYLFFRAHEVEWWIGPEVGGSECLARADGSLLQVVPRTAELVWQRAAATPQKPSGPESAPGSTGPERDVEVGVDELQNPHESVVVLALSTAVLGLVMWLAISGKFSASGEKPVSEVEMAPGIGTGKGQSLELFCVVCLEAPRQVLLLPCHHVCCCKSCAQRLGRCPVCRAETTSLAEVFL
eukprot:TRINITY_DN26778_c0_g1_i1.p1 TRINITY_DN26778_c0_g1~~TRINITY_DN26778_c0_g1_i1.p1  ORF type:complete len:615 (+),score=91.89 TRINITY_DN26778_c0_g1_i1:125-1969(+)